MSHPKSQSREVDFLESIDRARNFFGDPYKRWEDRLTLKSGSAYIENYISGRAALILQCNFPSVRSGERNDAGFFGEVISPPDRIPAFIFKANIKETHKLQHFDEFLMLISDIHVVQGAEGGIPSRVGFNVVQDNVGNFCPNSLLFQNLNDLSFKFFPRIFEWKSTPFCGCPTTSKNELVVEMVERTSKVMENVPNNKTGRIFEGIEGGHVDIEPQRVCSLFQIFFDFNGVRVRVREGYEQLVEVREVFFGPFNLEP